MKDKKPSQEDDGWSVLEKEFYMWNKNFRLTHTWDVTPADVIDWFKITLNNQQNNEAKGVEALAEKVYPVQKRKLAKKFWGNEFEVVDDNKEKREIWIKGYMAAVEKYTV
jgi:hypothetical protein